jgi:hypothetical protein
MQTIEEVRKEKLQRIETHFTEELGLKKCKQCNYWMDRSYMKENICDTCQTK